MQIITGDGSFQLHSFGIIFLSIILEGFPFILIGTFVSSLIQVFVSNETISRLIPKNKIIGLLCAAFIGIIFPVCECAIIPITRRLMRKGVPVSLATTFMLAVPIINPVCITSTYYAFIDKPYMVFMRIIFGVIGAITIGYLMGHINSGNPFKQELEHEEDCSCDYHKGLRRKKVSPIGQVLGHLSSEFYEVGKFFIIGALLSSALQSFIPREILLSIGKGSVSSILVMFALAFILSICSETDAFIGRTFMSQFTSGSIIGFLVLGPMLDLKNTFMLFGSFKGKYVLKLVFLIVSICFIMACLANIFTLKLGLS